MGALAADTEVTGGSDGDVGRYRGEVHGDWAIWGANGGYLACFALRAVAAHTGRLRPASLTCQFLRPGRFEPIELDVRTVRRTRRADAVHVVARQGDDDIFTAQVWAVAELEGLEHASAPLPAVTSPADTPTIGERMAEAGLDHDARFRFWDNLDARPLDFVARWEDRVDPEPRATGWYRFHGPAPADPWVDACRSTVLVDTFTWPAASRPHGPGAGMIAPSLDLAMQFHADVADSEWLLVEELSPIGHRGTMGCTGRVWSQDGRLAGLGSGTLLCVPAPPGPG